MKLAKPLKSKSTLTDDFLLLQCKTTKPSSEANSVNITKSNYSRFINKPLNKNYINSNSTSFSNTPILNRSKQSNKGGSVFHNITQPRNSTSTSVSLNNSYMEGFKSRNYRQVSNFAATKLQKPSFLSREKRFKWLTDRDYMLTKELHGTMKNYKGSTSYRESYDSSLKIKNTNNTNNTYNINNKNNNNNDYSNKENVNMQNRNDLNQTYCGNRSNSFLRKFMDKPSPSPNKTEITSFTRYDGEVKNKNTYAFKQMLKNNCGTDRVLLPQNQCLNYINKSHKKFILKRSLSDGSFTSLMKKTPLYEKCKTRNFSVSKEHGVFTHEFNYTNDIKRHRSPVDIEKYKKDGYAGTYKRKLEPDAMVFKENKNVGIGRMNMWKAFHSHILNNSNCISHREYKRPERRHYVFEHDDSQTIRNLLC